MVHPSRVANPLVETHKKPWQRLLGFAPGTGHCLDTGACNVGAFKVAHAIPTVPYFHPLSLGGERGFLLSNQTSNLCTPQVQYNFLFISLCT